MQTKENYVYKNSFCMKQRIHSKENKQIEYYIEAINYKNILPKDEKYMFIDNTFMSDWYQIQKRRVKSILEKKGNYTKKDMELLEWMSILHTRLKFLWIQQYLKLQKEDQNSENYQKWLILSERAINDPDAYKNKTKKYCEAIDTFRAIEDYYGIVTENVKKVACKMFPYANLNILDLGEMKRHRTKNKQNTLF